MARLQRDDCLLIWGSMDVLVDDWAELTAAVKHLRPVEAEGAHAQTHLPGPRLANRDIVDWQNLGNTELMEADDAGHPGLSLRCRAYFCGKA
ncbi:hypothetical protein LK12_16705 [Novosphingobium malaysiense]|uniref:Uncharacterized protein n=1 Tax=Novosphingobium malaysiense TaxID=1348853 RepID=A0A0B1ZGP6_9SPHN|nr:hypothetical protein LK12_16705 [Novosphingobium malaysiense]